MICFCELSHKIMLLFCKPILKLRKNWVHSSTQKRFERKRVKCTKYQKKTCCLVHITRHVVFGTCTQMHTSIIIWSVKYTHVFNKNTVLNHFLFSNHVANFILIRLAVTKIINRFWYVK